MAVYTEVSSDEVRVLLQQLQLGALQKLQGCPTGIENTNYFLSTEQDGQTCDYVLTLFERLSFQELPFYLDLMKHLAERGLPVPRPAANAQGELVFSLKGKPTALVNKLGGKSEPAPSNSHCAALGTALARMHLAGRDFPAAQANLRALPWWTESVPRVMPFLQAGQAALMRAELEFQQDLVTTRSYQELPRGPIHADLFRDNVMFTEIDDEPHLSGIFDFYFAGVDNWVFDVAVCMNDWCVDLESGVHQSGRAASLLQAYNQIRPLTESECELLPAMLRGAALRFWISRLLDYHHPRAASLLKAHDPAHFERILRQRVDFPVCTGLLLPAP